VRSITNYKAMCHVEAFKANLTHQVKGENNDVYVFDNATYLVIGTTVSYMLTWEEISNASCSETMGRDVEWIAPLTVNGEDTYILIENGVAEELASLEPIKSLRLGY